MKNSVFVAKKLLTHMHTLFTKQKKVNGKKEEKDGEGREVKR